MDTRRHHAHQAGTCCQPRERAPRPLQEAPPCATVVGLGGLVACSAWHAVSTTRRGRRPRLAVRATPPCPHSGPPNSAPASSPARSPLPPRLGCWAGAAASGCATTPAGDGGLARGASACGVLLVALPAGACRPAPACATTTSLWAYTEHWESSKGGDKRRAKGGGGLQEGESERGGWAGGGGGRQNREGARAPGRGVVRARAALGVWVRCACGRTHTRTQGTGGPPTETSSGETQERAGGGGRTHTHTKSSHHHHHKKDGGVGERGVRVGG